jgi:hypothetical protein
MLICHWQPIDAEFQQLQINGLKLKCFPWSYAIGRNAQLSCYQGVARE